MASLPISVSVHPVTAAGDCRYNTDTNTWEQLPSLKAGITSAAVVAHDGFLYVTGERAAGAVFADISRRVGQLECCIKCSFE